MSPDVLQLHSLLQLLFRELLSPCSCFPSCMSSVLPARSAALWSHWKWKRGGISGLCGWELGHKASAHGRAVQGCSLHAVLGFGTGQLLLAQQQLSAILLC